MKLKKVSAVISENESQPLDPRFSPQAYQDLETTGAGRVQYYPEGDKLFNWLKTQNVGFPVGYVSDASVSELQKIFQGTNVSASSVYNQSIEYEQLSITATEKQQYASNYYLDVLSPAISVQINIAIAANNAGNIGAALAALAEADRLFAIDDVNQADAQQASAAASAALTRLDTYIRTGVINPKDPFQLDDPTVAAALQNKKRDEEIEKEIEKLAAENEELKSKRAWDTAKMIIGLGFDIATAAALINVLSGPADEVAVQAAKKGVQSVLDDIAVRSGGPASRAAKEFTRKNPGKYNPYLTDYQNKLARQQGLGSEAMPLRPLKNSHEFQLTNRQIKLLKEVKQPFVVPELPTKYKMNFTGKYSSQNTPDKTASSRSEELVASGNANGQRWKLNDKYWKGYETTERMNVIHDKVGHGDQAWERIIDEAKKKNGWRNREIQEQLNMIAHEKAMISENPDYISPFITVESVEVIAKDPLFKKLKKKMWQDYANDPGSHAVKPAYPSQLPAQRGMNGYHSKYGDRKDYYKRLDPHSAAAMPGGNGYNPDVDADTAFKNVMKKARANGSNK